MLKTRYLRPLALVVALMWATQTLPMFNNLKSIISSSFVYATTLFNRPNSTRKTETGSIKAFAKGEKKRAFRTLLALENGLPNLVDYEDNYCVSQKISELATEAHRKDLLDFFAQLFRTIVKKDIERGEPYTIDLGLTVAKDGSILMENMPLSMASEETVKKMSDFWQTGVSLLVTGAKRPEDTITFQRLIDICDKKATPTLAEIKLLELFNQTVLLKQKNSNKNSHALFPEISIVSEQDMKNLRKDLSWVPTGLYVKTDNKIYVLDTSFSATDAEIMCHEFGHARQAKNAEAKRIMGYDPLNNLTLPIPLKDATEVDADLESLYTHPDKLYLLKKYRRSTEYFEFPYLPHITLYYELEAHLRRKRYHVPIEQGGSSPLHYAQWALNELWREKYGAASEKYKGSAEERTENTIMQDGKKKFELGTKIANAPTSIFQTQEFRGSFTCKPENVEKKRPGIFFQLFGK